VEGGGLTAGKVEIGIQKGNRLQISNFDIEFENFLENPVEIC
jgi:hypothetical protein